MHLYYLNLRKVDCLVWDFESRSHSHRLVLFNVRLLYIYDIRSSQILKDLNWKPIEVDLKNRETVMTFKALTGQGPDYLQQLFTECNNDNYSLRSNNTKLALPKPRTNFLKRSFSYRAAKSWNELSNDDITEDFCELSVNAFKRRLDKTP